jgi:DNA-binding transcriptional LysR family regulator
MDFRDFDPGLLVALDALLTEKSVTRAGKRLNLSQPATSIILSHLRRYFGNELLVPAGRRMVLTPLAESLISRYTVVWSKSNTLSLPKRSSSRLPPIESSAWQSRIM